MIEQTLQAQLAEKLDVLAPAWASNVELRINRSEFNELCKHKEVVWPAVEAFMTGSRSYAHCLQQLADETRADNDVGGYLMVAIPREAANFVNSYLRRAGTDAMVKAQLLKMIVAGAEGNGMPSFDQIQFNCFIGQPEQSDPEFDSKPLLG